MPTYIVLLGPPGAGKGTQAKIVSAELGLAHISSGDIFRENIKNQTELGKLAATFINRGDLVPDDVTIGMIRERLARPDCAQGALLDGYPRTPPQAQALDEMLSAFDSRVTVVPFVQVPEEELVNRLSGRWICREQGHIFHEAFNPPKESGRCDFDGSELYQRGRQRDAVQRRIHVYLEQTAPLVEHYRQIGILADINGAQPIEKVTADLLAALPKRAGAGD